MKIQKLLLWESSPRSPLAVLLSLLCFFANALIDGNTQTSARVYFGCFAMAALVVGISLERRFISEDTPELDVLDMAPGMITVVGTAIESLITLNTKRFIRQIVIVTSFIVTILLALEYYNDGDLFAMWKWWKRKRAKRSNKPYGNSKSRKRKIFRFEEGSFIQRYEGGKRLGSGYFGTVVLVTDKSKLIKADNESRCFAAKCVNRAKLTYDEELQVRSEVAILTQIHQKHPYIVNLYDFYDEPTHFYLVLELMRGGELFDRIKRKEKYFEKDARVVVRTLASALSFLHNLDIVHRDLKPENILMESEGSKSRIKIADFGFARKVGKGCVTACGTPNYVAPEIVDGSVYGMTVDVWALGVITYILLGGFPPFHDENRPKLFRRIRQGEYSFPDPYFRLVSFQAQDFIRKCLTVDVKQRITAEEILEHPWVVGTNRMKPSMSSERMDSEVMEGAPELAMTQGLIQLFNARQRLRAGILAAIAANRMQAIVNLVRNESMRKENAKTNGG
jgi:calcium/calmodulin-dependent protein kinase I